MARQPIEPGGHGTIWFEQFWNASEEAPARRVDEESDPKPKKGQSFWRARVAVRDTNGEYREMCRKADGKEAAKRALERALKARPVNTSASTIQPSWTIERLAQYWLEHRRKTGLARKAGALRPSSLAQMEAAVRTVVLGERKSLVGGEWVLQNRTGGIPNLRLSECSRAVIQNWLAGLEEAGKSTKQCRAILTQMFDLAVKDEALAGNPMVLVEPTRQAPTEVDGLDVGSARRLRRSVSPEATRKGAGRRQNHDLADFVDVALGTGCRIGEALAIRWGDLSLDDATPCVLVSGTLLEPREGVPLSRSPMTKGGDARMLFLPEGLVSVLRTRQERLTAAGRSTQPDEAVFSTRTGHWVSPANIRARLRSAVASDPMLVGTTPHTLRRTVATEIREELGLDAARRQLGHVDPGITGRKYIVRRNIGPDARETLQRFFEPE